MTTHHTCAEKRVIEMNSSLPLLFMLNSGYVPKITCKVPNCIVPASMLYTMPRNPFCIQPGISSTPIYSIHWHPIPVPLWVLHPSVGRSCTFLPLWAEHKYLEASSFLHWADWKKWCRHFCHSVRG